MATIGKLSAVLTANTAGFTRAMKQAGGTMARLGKQAAKVGAAVAAVGAAGVAAAAGGLAALTREGLKSTDALGKNADRLGLTTEELAAFHQALELGGAAISTGETALQRMSRRLADAQKGAGPAAKALETLGVNAAELAEKSPLEAFALIGEALARMENTAERTAAQFALFDTEGGRLFATLKGGRQGIADAADQAERLGLAISRTDAAQVEAANDAMQRLGRIFTGIGRQLAVAVAPIITKISEYLGRVATQAGGVGARVEAAISGIIGAAATLGDGIDAIREGMMSLEALWLDWQATALEALEKVGSKTAAVAGGLVSALNPAAGAAFQAMLNAAGAGLAGDARAMADEASRRARIGLTGTDSLGNRIRQFGQSITQPGTAPPTKQSQDETVDAVEVAAEVIVAKLEEVRDELSQIGTSTVNSRLLRLIDRLVLATANARGTVISGPSAAEVRGATAL